MPIYTLYLDPIHYGLFASVVVVLGVIDALSDVGSGWVLTTYFHDKNINRKQLTFNLILVNAFMRLGIVTIFYILGDVILSKAIPVSYKKDANIHIIKEPEKLGTGGGQ